MENTVKDTLTSTFSSSIQPAPKAVTQLLQLISPKLELTLETIKSKFNTTPPASHLFIKPSDFTPTFKTLTTFTFQSENPATDKFATITDCLNFVSFASIEPKLIVNLLNCLSPKGTLLLVLSLDSVKQIHSVLKAALPKEYNVSLFLKFFIVDMIPFFGLLSIQTMSESSTPIDFDTLKLMFYTLNEDNSLSKPLSYQLNVLAKVCLNMNRLITKSKELTKLVPYRIEQVPVYENYSSDNVDLNLIIVDYGETANSAKELCVVVVNKAYMADIIFLSKPGIIQMCQQTNASRVILVRSAPFNYDTTQMIRQKIYSSVMLFLFEGCQKENIKVRLMSDEKSEQYVVFNEQGYYIRDLVINENKETYRQLFAAQYNEEVLYQERLLLTSKAKAKQDSSYIPLITIDKFAQKNLVSCFDDKKVLSYFVNAILSSILFINLDFYPETPFHILVIGGNLGIVGYYCNKLLKGHAEITMVESNQTMTRIGKTFFGMNNFDSIDSSNITWHFEPLAQYILNIKKKDYYDMIIIDYWRGDITKGTIPPEELFTTESLTQIVQSLKPNGIFLMNLLSRGFVDFIQAFNSLEKAFPLMYSMANNEPLDKIFFCFKTKMTEEDYKNNYKTNLPKLSNNKDIADISVILDEHERILKKIEDMESIRLTINSQLY